MLRCIASLVAAIVIISCLAVASSFVQAENFNPNTFHMVDYFPSSNAFLFRSNQPSIKGSDGKETFAYSDVYNTMVLRATTQANVTFPSAAKVYMVIIAVNTIFESGVLEDAEFFEKNPNLGKWMNWPIVGDAVHPEDVSAAERDEMLRNGTVWKIDQIPSRLAEVRSMLHQGPPAGYDALAIVYHCAGGCDRTGEFSMSYMIQYAPALAGGRFQNFTSLYELDCTQKYGCGRCSNYFGTGGAAWYCLWWNMFNASQAGLQPYPDCMSAYKCDFLKSCQPASASQQVKH